MKRQFLLGDGNFYKNATPGTQFLIRPFKNSGQDIMGILVQNDVIAKKALLVLYDGERAVADVCWYDWNELGMPDRTASSLSDWNVSHFQNVVKEGSRR